MRSTGGLVCVTEAGDLHDGPPVHERRGDRDGRGAGPQLRGLRVRIDLEAPLFSVRSDDDLIVPFAIRVVFPFRLNDLSAGRLLVDCLLDRGGERL